MNKLKCVILIVLIILSVNANAKTNMGISIDWSIAKADYIITGKITNVEIASPLDSSLYFYFISVDLGEIIKGSNGLTNNGKLGFGTNGLPDYYKNENALIGKNVTLFLKWNNTTKCLELFDDYVDGFCYLHYAYSILDNDYNSHKVLTIGFNALQKGADVVEYIKKKAPTYQKDADAYIFAKIEIPFDTKAHGVLYAGSMCYLGVPKIKIESDPRPKDPRK
jgi:hypothetical protein